MTYKVKDRQCFTCHIVKPFKEYDGKERRCKSCVDHIFSKFTFTHKTCSRCKTEKPIKQFHQSKSTKDGLYPLCNVCSQAAKAKTRKAKPTSLSASKTYKTRYKSKNPQRQKEYERRRGLAKFGLTIEDYYRLLDTQNNCCAICKKHEDCFKVALAVDHDHITNKIRGLLCSSCNTALGLLNDSIPLLKASISYLEDNK